MTVSLRPVDASYVGRVPSGSQREAIEAPPQSMLVLAGPGAGKTFCLTERIHFLIERAGFAPERICAFTFTNKAAGEIAHRLEMRLGAAAAKIKRGTIHAFCAEVLREFAAHIGLDAGFGIADEEYQLGVLARIEGRRRWHKRTLSRFSANRFRDEALRHDDVVLLDAYEQFLAKRRLLDFDMLVLRAAEVIEQSDVGAAVRSRWDVVLVDEFQDLNPVQYRVVRALAREHRHVFAVGDDEQSIYSWAGADPTVFKSFVNDFNLSTKIHLEENRRCPHQVFALARKLVSVNTPIFADRVVPRADRESTFDVTAFDFENDDAEIAWIIDDIRRDKALCGHEWGDVALLYRTHSIGNSLEAAFLNAGIPCRLAHGRALSEDPVVGYVISALRLILCPDDDLYRDALFRIMLPRAFFEEARAQAEASRHSLARHLTHLAARLPRAHEHARQIRRALADWRNLAALGKRHATLGSLVQELLSRRIGKLRSALDERHDEISDPASLPDVVALANRLRAAREAHAEVWMPRMGGVEIALKGILAGIGFTTVRLAGDPPTASGAVRLGHDDVPSVGIALGVYKAAQLIEMVDHAAAFTSFTAIDLETTGRNTGKAEIVEIAAVRVRDGRLAESFHSLVKPHIPIELEAMAKHGIREVDVAPAPRFEDIWPKFRAFCGDDVIVAHNGYDFDFKILARMSRDIGKPFDLCTYDTLPLARDLFPTSRKLEHLAPLFGIPTGRSHRALDDTRALAQVVLKLDEMKQSRARKTALVNLLDHLGVALALSDDASLCAEARMFRGVARAFALSQYSSCLEAYEREQADDLTIPTVDEVIEQLGGGALMVKIRAKKSAEERYPAVMQRLRRLIAEIDDGPLEGQISLFLERALLSRWEGQETDTARVNLLTLHSTKGLEFSRVYVVGVEDAQMPGGSPTVAAKPAEIEEARRLLYVGMTRTKDRLVLTRAATRGGEPTRGHQFLDEMALAPRPPEQVT